MNFNSPEWDGAVNDREQGQPSGAVGPSRGLGGAGLAAPRNSAACDVVFFV